MKEKIEFNYTELDANITADKLTFSASELSHIRTVKNLHNVFKKLWDAYNKAICAKLDGQSTETIHITNRSYCIVDEQKLVELYGEDALEKVKVKPVVQQFVNSL